MTKSPNSQPQVLSIRFNLFRMSRPPTLVRVNAPTRPAPTAAPSRRRKGRVAILVGLVLVLAIQVGTGIAINTEWSPLRDPLYFDKLALLHQYRAFFPGPSPPPDKPVTMLLVGSSRTLNAADATAASHQLTGLVGRPVEVFNFGQAGAGPVTNAVYLRRLTQEGMKPDFVLIEVHPVFLAGQRPDPPELRWLLSFRLRPDELPVVQRMGFPAGPPPTHGPRGYLAPIYDYRFLILDRYAPFFIMLNSRLNGGHESDSAGFARLNEHVTPERRAALLRHTFGQYADYFPGYRPTGPGVAAIRASLDRCRAAGWRAGMILMPESTEVRAWYPPDGLQELDTLLAGLSAEYGVPVIDARTWAPDHQTEDGHHLTGPGADKVTERLTREALAPWIARALSPQPRPVP